jgi:hypothetical protein
MISIRRAMPRIPTNREIITCARIDYADADKVAIAQKPTVTHEKTGAWVAAKLWVPYAAVDAGD